MSEKKYVVLRPITFGAIGKSLRSGDLIVQNTEKRTITINGDGPFPDQDMRAIKTLEERAGKQFLAEDTSFNRKEAKKILDATEKKNRDVEGKSIYEAEKFDVVSEDGQIVQEIEDGNVEHMGHRYPREAKQAAKDPGKPKASKIGGEGSFREDLAYKEGIETDFPIIQDNSSVALIDPNAKSLNAGRKPTPTKAAEPKAEAKAQPKRGRKPKAAANA